MGLRVGVRVGVRVRVRVRVRVLIGARVQVERGGVAVEDSLINGRVAVHLGYVVEVIGALLSAW